jgi:copper resistance protein B
MKTILALLVAGAAAPAAAQHSGHSAPAAPATSSCIPEHAAAGYCTLPAPPAQQAPAAPAGGTSCTPEHAAMGHCTLPAPAPKLPPAAPPSSATCAPEHAAAGHCTPAPQPAPAAPASDPSCPPEHAAMGHCTPSTQPQNVADPHAGHDMSATAVDVAVAPPPAEAQLGPENAADTAWGTAAMEPSRSVLFEEHGDIAVAKLLVDQLETRIRSGRDGYYLNAQGWYGGDIDKLWLKTEVEGSFGSRPEQAEFQALWSHAIDPWFDFQTGVRFDAEPDNRGHLVAGIQGLAPYWIEVEAAAFLSDKGDVTARVEAEHDVRVTRTLVLQPRTELNFSLQDIPRRGVGSGLSNAELGLRLRYEIEPNFAPYVGVHYERAFGDTRRYLKDEGEGPDSWHLVAGIRTWF